MLWGAILFLCCVAIILIKYMRKIKALGNDRETIDKIKAHRDCFCYWSLVVFGLIPGIVIIPMFYRGITSRSWPSTIGQVIQSEYDYGEGEDKFCYTYTIKEQSYKSKRESTCIAFWNNMVEEYPKGSIVTVYYNPDDPGDAVLVPGFTKWHYFYLIALVFYFATYIYASVKTTIKFRKLRRQN